MRFVWVLLTAGWFSACAADLSAKWTEKELNEECMRQCELEKEPLCEFHSSNPDELQQCLDDPHWCDQDCAKLVYN